MAHIPDYDEGSIHLREFFAENFFDNFDANKSQFKPSELFSNISFEMLKKRNALDTLVSTTKLSDFQQATHEVQELSQRDEPSVKHEMEEK